MKVYKILSKSQGLSYITYVYAESHESAQDVFNKRYSPFGYEIEQSMEYNEDTPFVIDHRQIENH